jgi:predicted RNA polymerase sigma factor
VIALLFTEGHTGSRGTALVRPALLDQALRPARLLPGEPEVLGLPALLLHDSRRAARMDPGDAGAAGRPGPPRLRRGRDRRAARLSRYHRLHAARAEILARLGRHVQSRAAYRRAADAAPPLQNPPA